jgi:hypothetical protein
VSAIDAAFRVRLDTYKASAAASASPYTLYANDRQVSLPSYLAGSVLGVTGLDNAGPVIPLATPRGELGGQAARAARAGAAAPPCSHYYGQHMATGLPKQFGTTSFPTTLCGYSADQMRAASPRKPSVPQRSVPGWSAAAGPQNGSPRRRMPGAG